MDKTFSKAIVQYGMHNQCVVAVEELSELQKEICKALRGQPNKENMTEELADCWIVIEQLKMMFNITDADVQKVVWQKTTRLKERLSQ
jgi:NTP pyrophosphatase (non-canonical NTP hydrolase)